MSYYVQRLLETIDAADQARTEGSGGCVHFVFNLPVTSIAVA